MKDNVFICYILVILSLIVLFWNLEKDVLDLNWKEFSNWIRLFILTQLISKSCYCLLHMVRVYWDCETLLVWSKNLKPLLIQYSWTKGYLCVFWKAQRKPTENLSTQIHIYPDNPYFKISDNKLYVLMILIHFSTTFV
jgi:hypothetical protein